jgi:hypothetical protein
LTGTTATAETGTTVAAETDHSTEVETEETKVTNAVTGKSRDSVSKKVTVQGTGTTERETMKGRTEDVEERGNLKEQQKITSQKHGQERIQVRKQT